MQESRAIVAGYDGSAEAAVAVRWAAQHARRRGLVLHVVHCSIWPLLTRHLGPVPGVSESGLERSAESVLEEGLEQAKASAPGLQVECTLLHGLPAQHLVQIAARQEMLVVGSRGLGGFLGLVVGSVSLELAATASCPVAVIRSDLHPDGPVVVAVDESGSPAPLRDACTMASAARASLVVVHVRHIPAGYRRFGDNAEAAAAAGEVVRAAVESARVHAPAVQVEGMLLTDSSVPHALLEASRDAAMLVVGSKGRGLVKETIGSTAHAVLHHAHGPVLVSRHGSTSR
ncbi:nucleotide-binding universal stress UspA family protein [Arthrobacter sp. SLBN-100]|uniref:universal stress protein n=1 Tax=Arthrobacter sp. SLBN-100 TaxID=2768450 RepID=UPI001151807A|nr:universal stress protein [Arthrobacter sp. SLBN-100]TQJ66810.1 nucleotide-binding universal stress UspA family protein [Arthrobacter sp. SLBN-100]